MFLNNNRELAFLICRKLRRYFLALRYSQKDCVLLHPCKQRCAAHMLFILPLFSQMAFFVFQDSIQVTPVPFSIPHPWAALGCDS